jgi:phosphoglycerate dehydrogenase-like enzyme
MPRVLISSPLPADAFRRFLPDGLEVELETLADRTEAGLAAAAPGADVLVADWLFQVPVSARVVEGLDSCRLIQQPSAGFQLIDLEAAARRGIPVANAPGNDVAVAEWAVMAVIALLRRAFEADRRMRQGEWPTPELARGSAELAGKVVGIVGYGRIGRQVARRLAAFDCEVLAYDVVRADGMPFAELADLLARADAVTVHVPLTRGTRHLVDPFAMKQGAVLVNAARGGVVDEGAIVAALDQGHLKGAALDVFDEEPLPPEAPIRANPLVVLSPHAAGVTRESGRRIIQMTADNVARVLSGEPPHWLVGPTLP